MKRRIQTTWSRPSPDVISERGSPANIELVAILHQLAARPDVASPAAGNLAR